MTDTLMNTYARLPVEFVRGEGAWLIDANGQRYLDGVSGVAVCSLGHAHPGVSEALCEQANTLVHTSNLYGIHHQRALADRLCELSGMQRAFFSNSGAEANEAAIKIARLYGHQRGIDLPSIVVMDGSFHGRTLATLTATGNRKVQAGFEPLVQGFVRAPYNDLEAVQNIARNNNKVVAILVEPILGEGGVIIPEEGYLQGLREICDENNWLLMVDEIQTGMGRTGKWFAHQHCACRPDVMTLAKALGNGVPIGACLVNDKGDVFEPGNHGSTFGGNPLACRAALAVIESLTQDSLIERAVSLGERIRNGFNKSLANVSGVQSIRGKGLMIGIELNAPCGELVKRALQQGILINVTAESVIRLLPPLILTDAEADQLVHQVSTLVQDFVAEAA